MPLIPGKLYKTMLYYGVSIFLETEFRNAVGALEREDPFLVISVSELITHVLYDQIIVVEVLTSKHGYVWFNPEELEALEEVTSHD